MRLALCLILLFAICKKSAEASVTCDLVRCPGDHTCKLKSVISCQAGQECETIISPVCVPNLKDGECPVQELTEITESNCILDSDCDGNLKCCPHKNNSYCFKPCRKMMCKCSADTKLVYVNNSKGCPVCTCVTSNETESVVDCTLPKEVGKCRARFSRFYYNAETKSCEKFIYGGCTGNSNNFFTKQACENKCLPKEAKAPTILQKCSQPVKRGMCKGYFERFFYNTTSNLCEKFIYGGCQSNENNFETLALCNEQCNDRTLNRLSLLPKDQVCNLDAEPGPCYASFNKFSFNKATNKCEKFTYGGCGGNANRFDTKSECEKACPANETVSSLNLPVADRTCLLEKKPGSCRGYFERYFYNEAVGECQLFVYGGCEGNENNFQSKEKCEEKCKTRAVDNVTLAPASFIAASVEPTGLKKNFNVQSCNLKKDSGPCEAYFEMFFFNADMQKCEKFIYGGCQGNENRFQTIEECESSCIRPASLNPAQVHVPFNKNVCKLAKDQGPCLAFFEMFAFNSNTGKCEQFVYGGCQGNGNRFATEKECQDSCGNVNKVIEMRDICKLEKQPGSCRGYLERYHFDTATNECQMFVYGGCEGNANNFESKAECQRNCLEINTAVEEDFDENNCYLPSEAGPCYAYVPSYFYNAEANKCEKFVYGGCQGNGNRFNSAEQCEKSCAKVHKELLSSVNKCELDVDAGLCRGYFEKFYYDKSAKICKQFVYGGCGGNQNNFDSLADCNSECLTTEDRQVVDPCTLPAQPGRCLAYFERFFFNSLTKKCEMFVYGGCEANANNFMSLSECEAKCTN